MESPAKEADKPSSSCAGFDGKCPEGCTTLDVKPLSVLDGEMTKGSAGKELSVVEGEASREQSEGDVITIEGVSIPNVGDAIRMPYEGMEFDSEEAVKTFYNEYARQVGFGTRVSNSYRSKKDGNFISKKIVCAKAGFRVRKETNKDGKPKRARTSLRVGCKAMILVRKQESGKWVLVKFVKEHCHALESPSRVHLIRSHKRAFDTTRNMIQSFERPGIAAGRLMPVFIEEGSGCSNGDLSGGDCRSLLRTERRRTFGSDAQMLLEYFQRKHAENPAFFYAIQVDEDQCLANIFWVEAKSRMTYEYFGDVVTFDTTYKTNQFRMPFAPFTGVNNHLHPVVFGCALLSSETEASFIWLFKTWLAAMFGRHPISIITDQDEAIKAAVTQIFPETHHRFCMRHIQRRKQDKLSHVLHEHKQFDRDFHKCIHETETSEEFETSWQSLLENYDLSNNEWLKSLYQDRQQWIPLYLKDKFFADMTTTNRIENTKAFFDGYVHAQTTLQLFLTQYEKALVSHYEKEMKADFDTSCTTLVLKTPSIIEEQAANIYTRNIFSIFQEELIETWNYVTKKKEMDGVIATYSVTRFEQEYKVHTVILDTAEERVSCSCKMFEFSGMLCRHILSVFRVAGIFKIPSHYILTRWTRSAKHMAMFDECGNEFQNISHDSLLMRFSALCIEAIKCSDEGSTSIEISNLTLRSLRDTRKRIAAAKESIVKDVPGRNLVTGSSQVDSISGG